jgi:hypothetical protein
MRIEQSLLRPAYVRHPGAVPGRHGQTPPARKKVTDPGTEIDRLWVLEVSGHDAVMADD